MMRTGGSIVFRGEKMIICFCSFVRRPVLFSDKNSKFECVKKITYSPVLGNLNLSSIFCPALLSC